MNLLRRFFRKRYLSDTGLPVGDPETGSEDVWTRELAEHHFELWDVGSGNRISVGDARTVGGDLLEDLELNGATAHFSIGLIRGGRIAAVWRVTNR